MPENEAYGEQHVARNDDMVRLLGRWTNSHEEDREGAKAFRRSDFAFPRSRGRTSLVFEDRGALSVEFAGPVDRGVTSQGSWSMVDGELTLDAAGWDGVWEIEMLSADLLIIRHRP